MKTAVEQFIEQLEAQGESWENVSIGRIQISINVEDYLKLIEQAKEMEANVATEYAEFCIRCDRASLKQVKFEDWKKSWDETFKQQEQ